MRYNFLTAFGVGIAILLMGSNSFIFAQTNDGNQTSGQANLSNASADANSSIPALDSLLNMSNITTPGGNVNTYR